MRKKVLTQILSLCFALFFTAGMSRCIFFDDNEEDDDCSSVPSNCNTTEPDSGDVLIKLNTERSVSPVIVEVYTGSVENGTLILEFRSENQNEFVLKMPNGDISARATYIAKINSLEDTVKTYDGDKLDADSDRYCKDVTCYEKGYIELDLRLEY